MGKYEMCIGGTGSGLAFCFRKLSSLTTLSTIAKTANIMDAWPRTWQQKKLQNLRTVGSIVWGITCQAWIQSAGKLRESVTFSHDARRHAGQWMSWDRMAGSQSHKVMSVILKHTLHFLKKKNGIKLVPSCIQNIIQENENKKNKKKSKIVPRH